MPTVIRRGIFETNSSSSHSLTVNVSDEEGKQDTLPVDASGTVKVYPGCFHGWDDGAFDDPWIKASYCMALAHAFGKKKHREMLERVIKEATGAKEVEFVKTGGQLGYGIAGSELWEEEEDEDDYHDDDRGQRSMLKALFSSEATLKAFIFNPKSTLNSYVGYDY